MNVKQFLCAGMTGALLVAGLTACAPGAPEVDPSDVAYQTAGVTRDTVLFTVDGTEVTADEYLFWLLQSVASAKQSGYLADDDAWEEELNGVPTAEYLKEDARNTSVLYTTVSNHAAAAGLTVTEEEQAEADAELETLTQRVDSYYGMTLQEYLDQQCISEAAFRKLNQVPYLARSLQTQMEEAGYYKAKHILLAFPENEDGSAVTDEQKAAVKAEADQLLAQIRTAADPLVEFDKVMNERSEDGRDADNQLYAPDGYLAYAGQMVPQFESAAKALAVGEISEPVETDYGYHIILRQDFTDEERQQLRDSMAAIYPDYAMSKLNEQWVEEAKVEVKPAYEKLDPNSFYKNMVAFAEQWQEEKAAEEAAQATASPAPETGTPAQSTEPAPGATGSGAQ
ncbi:peptidylprolyl isomerase [Flavonifractor plautii]|uniref:peptidylprolyl isomerase n=1 Tax=Flavonifractor plautii TaxID=292800 RepID=UPI0032ED652D